MKTVIRLIMCASLVFPLSIFAQSPNSPKGINCHADFYAQNTNSCGTTLSTRFIDESVIPDGDQTTSRIWKFGDGSVSYDRSPVHLYATPGVYTVKLIVKSSSGWTDSLTRTNYISVGPDVNLGPDTTISEPGSIELNAGNSGYGTTYLWSTGATSRKITVTKPGLYWVKVKRGNCVDRDTIRISINNVEPSLVPEFGFTIEGNCLPTIVHFTDSSIVGPGSSIVRWKWEFGDGTTSTEQHPSHTYTSSESFTVRLSVWDNNGYSMTRSKSVVINSIQGPIVNLGNDTSICQVEMIVLDAGNPDASFTWSTGDIFQSCVITNTAEVWVRVELNGCVATDTINIVVNPSLQPKFGFKKLGGICPVTYQFTDSSKTCGVEILQWSWDFGDGTTSDLQNPTHAYSVSGEYTVSLTVYDNYGYFIETSSRTVSIQVAPVHVNLGKDTSMCFGDLIVLNAGIEGATYLWSTGETAQEIGVMDDGTYWVTVNNGGCVGSDTIQVKTVFPVTPGFEYSINGNCLPVPVKFTDKSIENCVQHVVQWRWDFGDGTTSTEQNPVHTYTTSDSFAVRLTVTTDGGISVSKSKKIFVANSAPIVNAGNDVTICKGDIVQLDAGLDDAVYLWSPASSLDNATIRRPLANPYQTTTYTVSVTKCNATVTDQVVVSVNTQDKPVISQQGDKLVSTVGKTYQWYKNGEIIHGAKDKTYKPHGAGNYTVRVKTESNCLLESDGLFFIPNWGVGNWIKGIRVKCTPNPSHGFVYVLLSHLPKKPVRVTVIDRFGQRLFTTTIYNHSNLLNLSRLAKGYYTVELIVDNERITLPVVLQ